MVSAKLYTYLSRPGHGHLNQTWARKIWPSPTGLIINYYFLRLYLQICISRNSKRTWWQVSVDKSRKLTRQPVRNIWLAILMILSHAATGIKTKLNYGWRRILFKYGDLSIDIRLVHEAELCSMLMWNVNFLFYEGIILSCVENIILSGNHRNVEYLAEIWVSFVKYFPGDCSGNNMFS